MLYGVEGCNSAFSRSFCFRSKLDLIYDLWWHLVPSYDTWNFLIFSTICDLIFGYQRYLLIKKVKKSSVRRYEVIRVQSLHCFLIITWDRNVIWGWGLQWQSSMHIESYVILHIWGGFHFSQSHRNHKAFLLSGLSSHDCSWVRFWVVSYCLHCSATKPQD